MTTDDNAALIIRPDQTEWTAPQLKVIQELSKDKNGYVVDPEDPILLQFLHKCQRTKLDPFSAQIYLVNKGRFSIQTGIDGYRIIAQRTGEYAGQEGPFWCGPNGVFRDVWLDAQNNPAAAKVGIYRKGFIKPVWGSATWNSYGSFGPIWKKMPDVMIAKCAEALGLRKAFPDDLAGIYTAEEMAQSEVAEMVINAEITPIQSREEETLAMAESFRYRLQEIEANPPKDAEAAAPVRNELKDMYREVGMHGIDTEMFNTDMTLLDAVKYWGGEMKKLTDGGTVTVQGPAYPWSTLSRDSGIEEWERHIDKITSEQELHDLKAHAKQTGVLPAIEGTLLQASEDLKAPGAEPGDNTA